MSALDDCDLDMDVSAPEEVSKKESVLGLMKERDLLRYGAIISESDVEYVMGIKKEESKADNWQLIKLQLREVIKSQGFYVTGRGRQDDLYIMLPHEMPTYNEKKNKANYRNLTQRTRALHMIDQSILSDEHKKKLEFEIFQNAHFQIEMGKSIKKRCR